MSTVASSIALSIKNLTIQFGGLTAVSDFSLDIPKSMIFGLIGPNGAGKTTVFNMLTGVYQPTSGNIHGFGKNLVGLEPYEITPCGIARTFQNIRLFKDLNIIDNLLISLDHHPHQHHHGILSHIFKTKKAKDEETEKLKHAQQILKIFGLESKEEWLAKNLPYGDQRKLEIARAMATGAQLLLLDEPAAGLNGHETAELMSTIKRIRNEHQMTILLIEHDMKLVMGICERIAVLDYGIKIAEGTPQEIQKNPKVVEAYLGKSS